MAELRSEKYVNSLPATLVANTIYYVKNGANFDMYITNNSGTIIAYPLNTSPIINNSTWVVVDVIVPSSCLYYRSNYIFDNSLTLDSTVELQWVLIYNQNFENEPEMTNVEINPIIDDGAFKIEIISKDNIPFVGIFTLKYKINN
jgi:hypothetical protein